MRRLYRNALSENDINYLKNSNVKFGRINKDKNPVVDKVLKLISSEFEFKVKDESYFRIEQTLESGHPWHVDTGSNNHMLWCQVGLSVILASDCEGGETEYEDGVVNRGVGDLIVHTSDVKHQVRPFKGYRLTFLMFI